MMPRHRRSLEQAAGSSGLFSGAHASPSLMMAHLVLVACAMRASSYRSDSLTTRAAHATSSTPERTALPCAAMRCRRSTQHCDYTRVSRAAAPRAIRSVPSKGRVWRREPFDLNPRSGGRALAPSVRMRRSRACAVVLRVRRTDALFKERQAVRSDRQVLPSCEGLTEGKHAQRSLAPAAAWRPGGGSLGKSWVRHPGWSPPCRAAVAVGGCMPRPRPPHACRIHAAVPHARPASHPVAAAGATTR